MNKRLVLMMEKYERGLSTGRTSDGDRAIAYSVIHDGA